MKGNEIMVEINWYEMSVVVMMFQNMLVSRNKDSYTSSFNHKLHRGGMTNDTLSTIHALHYFHIDKLVV